MAELEHRKQLFDKFANILPRHPCVLSQGEPDVLSDRHRIDQGVVLKHHRAAFA